MIDCKCLACGKEFKEYPSKIKIGRGKYCSRSCSQPVFAELGKEAGRKTRFKKGQKPWNTKGWKYQRSRKNGKLYILLHMPEHPDSDTRGYIRKHRYLMEQKIGRRIKKKDVVHHIDGNTLNNSLDNLMLMTKIEHDRLHVKDNVHKRWIERSMPNGN